MAEEKTKLMLSAGELEFVQDTEWVLTKRRITETVCALLNEQVPVISFLFQPFIASHIPELLAGSPKISKGENYRSLPYVILDYPALFKKDDVFALRTMFWWGKFMSITLHVAGQYALKLRETLDANLAKDPADFYVCIAKEQWEHHFEPSNYLPAQQLANAGIGPLSGAEPFIKLALKYDLEKWEELPGLLKTGYTQISRLLMD